MPNITNLSSDSKAFILSTNSSGKTRSLAASIAIARVLCDRCYLPSEAVECAKTFFATTYSGKIDIELSTINEFVPVDVNSIRDLIKKIYETRYNVAFAKGPRIIDIREDAHPTLDFFGISRTIEEAFITELKTNRAFINDCLIHFKKILDEITVASQPDVENQPASLGRAV